MGVSNHLGNSVLDAVFRGEGLQYNNVYISLHTGDPDGNGQNELAGNNYARQETSPSDWTPADARETENANIIEFDELPAATISHVGVWDSLENGEFLWGGALDETQEVSEGDVVRFSVGEITASIDPE